VRRLRRILPEGTTILVGYWAEEPETLSVKALLETAEADAYATSLAEAVAICVKAAKGELAGKEKPASEEPTPSPEVTPPPAPKASKRPATTPRKSQSAVA
jgi:hypothetical protein